MSTRRLTEHKRCTLDGEELLILTIWEENTGKQEIRKQLPFCKKQELLVKYGNKFEFIQKQA